MKEHPILFSTEMVQAILEGRKTQTRRVIKPQPDSVRRSVFVRSGWETCHGYEIKCPYGRPGDRLWVRETWRPTIEDRGYDVHGEREFWERPPYFYKADNSAGCWRPSIHMPKSAARIWLEVVDVQVERLQDISEEDAIKEGLFAGIQIAGPNSTPAGTAKQGFMWLWQSLNDKRGYGWSINPWVWVVEFRRVEA